MVLHELCTPSRMFIGRSRVELIRILYAIRRRRMGGLTMTEELVTLETAKMLREKGFNEYCKDIIREDNGRMMQSVFRTNKDLPKGAYSRPTQSIAAKWIRETKNLHISIIRNACGYGYDICKADNGTHITDGIFKGPNDGGQWDTYEEALEVGIQEALKLV